MYVNSLSEEKLSVSEGHSSGKNTNSRVLTNTAKSNGRQKQHISERRRKELVEIYILHIQLHRHEQDVKCDTIFV